MNYIQDVASEIKGVVPASVLPDEPTDRLFLYYAVLALTKGESVALRDVHDAWSAWMTEIDPSHESIRPFEELDPDVRGEDDPYVNAIRTVARSRRGAD